MVIIVETALGVKETEEVISVVMDIEAVISEGATAIDWTDLEVVIIDFCKLKFF